LLKECPTTTSKEASDVVMRQGRQMARLLDDLLDVSRVTRGKIDIRKEVVNLNQLVHEAVEVAKPEIEERGHSLELRLSDTPLYVEGDPARLLQIQENLLVNAAKYTPHGGRIIVSICRDKRDAVISVEDNGQGIPPEMLADIFELFVQGHKSLARSEGGMGIGLSLVRTLVELHGGTVSVHSDGCDHGSIFTVRLPLTDKKPPRRKANPSVAEKNLRVLIVEDNDDSREILEKLLRMDGHRVSVAADGVSGYEAVRRQRPDVVLLDIGLPGMDGYQVAQRIRAELPNHPVRLVALTGYGRAEDHAAVMRAGFDEHLIKPVGPRELSHVLRKRPS
jgi:CheY-like chemotaxis protein